MSFLNVKLNTILNKFNYFKGEPVLASKQLELLLETQEEV